MYFSFTKEESNWHTLNSYLCNHNPLHDVGGVLAFIQHTRHLLNICEVLLI
jgi:hypothetical protein